MDDAQAVFADEPGLVARLALDQDIDCALASGCVRELHRFLAVAAASGERLAPSPLVDAAWHEVLREGEAYAAYCRAELGCVIGHSGPDGRVDEAAYGRSKALLTARFGPLDTSVWGATPAMCTVVDAPAPSGSPGPKPR